MEFLHGIEHLNLPADFVPVNDVVTAVIGLVGTAGAGEANEIILCKSEKDDAQFGTNGTIPEALKAIRMQDGTRGSALVLVVKVTPANGDTIVAEDIVGTVDVSGVRTGLKLFETALGQFGFEPMIYIVPHYSALGAVKQELIVITDKTEAMAYIDTPDGYTFKEALASRGNDGDFSKLTDGQKLLFPHFLVPNPKYNPEVEETIKNPEYNSNTNPDVPETIPNPEYTPEVLIKYLNVPMSAFCAGLRAKIDMEEGWHVSSSNHRITGVEGMDVALTFALGDLSSEANLLNSKGVTTAVNMYGNGIVEWGNYAAGFPGNTNTEAFECVRRTRAIMKRTIEQACVRFVDKPFIKANVDAIRNTVNQYLNGLKAQGKIVEGQCFYLPESNSLNELAQGHLTFDIEFTPAIPMQRLTFTYKIDLTALSAIE
ncbi:MAG: phage tail sheath subtilisin-like domain-containing protein [Prevotellaceae bacterium]|jgi:phage tail sheath protein FI|nr:phage tail sheath subtilisin-like domain-containing protein [Prevotellaceae bacterium]